MVKLLLVFSNTTVCMKNETCELAHNTFDPNEDTVFTLEETQVVGCEIDCITISEIPTRASHRPSTRRSSRGLHWGVGLLWSEYGPRRRPGPPRKAAHARIHLRRYRAEQPYGRL